MGTQSPRRVDERVISRLLRCRRSTGPHPQGLKSLCRNFFFRPFGAKSFYHSTHGSRRGLYLAPLRGCPRVSVYRSGEPLRHPKSDSIKNRVFP